MADRTLRDLRLRDEGIVVIGIQRRGQDYRGAPTPETVVCPRDTLIVYGKSARIAELDRRGHGPAGDAAHAGACAEEREEQASVA